MSRARNWCATINNFVDADIAALHNMPADFIIWGEEVGENGTPHLQIYFQLPSRMRLTAVRELLPRAHLEVARGSAAQNIEYCSKDGVVTSVGEPRHQGERTDLDTVRNDAAENGMRHVTRWANCQQMRVAEKFLTYNEEPRDWKPHVTWLYGPPGSGKTRRAHALTSEDRYIKSSSSKWWDGYDGQTDVIIDDFRESWCPLQELLALLDRYEHRVEFKGGTRQFLARNIVVTSPLHPGWLYRFTDENIEQLLRRIDVLMGLPRVDRS